LVKTPDSQAPDRPSDHRTVLREATRHFPALVVTGRGVAGKNHPLTQVVPKRPLRAAEDPDIRARVRADPRACLDELRPPLAQHCWRAQKRFYVLRLSILEPKAFAGRMIVSRLYCTPKAMWRLGWTRFRESPSASGHYRLEREICHQGPRSVNHARFLRDFLCEPELLSQDEVDERALRGLVGVVKISHTVVNGISLVNFDGFAPSQPGSGEEQNLITLCADCHARMHSNKFVGHRSGTGAGARRNHGMQVRVC
jgi:hypothetical protein